MNSTLEPARILSRRLELVPVMACHARAMFPVLSSEALYEHTGDSPPGNTADLEHWFRALESRASHDGTERWFTWILFKAGGSEAIGYVQATIAGGRADAAWLVGIDWQGRGYASEAACALVAWLTGIGVPEITAHIKPGHTASEGVARAAGFSPTGLIRDGEDIWSYG